MRIIRLVAITLMALSFGGLPAQAETLLHSFAKAAYHLPTNGRQVTQAELAANPTTYFRPGAYAKALWYLGLDDAGFRVMVLNARVVACDGNLSSLAFGTDGRAYRTTRACAPGEQLLVQKNTGRVLLSLGCLNPVVGTTMAVSPVLALNNQDGGDRPRKPKEPPEECQGEGCNPPPPPECEGEGCGPKEPPNPPECKGEGCGPKEPPEKPKPPKPEKPKGNNGVGNGEDPAPPGEPPVNDGEGTAPGEPGNKGHGKK